MVTGATAAVRMVCGCCAGAIWAVSGCVAAGTFAGCCAAALKASNRKLVNMQCLLAISLFSTFASSIRQLENHMYDCRRINRHAIAQGRLETHFVRGSYGCLVQTMTKPAYHPVHVEVSVCAKHHFQQDFTFQLRLAGFIGIKRTRFKDDFDRRGRWTAVWHGPGLGAAGCNFLRAELRSLHAAAV